MGPALTVRTVDRRAPRKHVRSKPFCGECGMKFRTWNRRYQHAPKCAVKEKQPLRRDA